MGENGGYTHTRLTKVADKNRRAEEKLWNAFEGSEKYITSEESKIRRLSLFKLDLYPVCEVRPANALLSVDFVLLRRLASVSRSAEVSRIVNPELDDFRCFYAGCLLVIYLRMLSMRLYALKAEGKAKSRVEIVR